MEAFNVNLCAICEQGGVAGGGAVLACKINPWKWEKRVEGDSRGNENKKKSEEIERGAMQDGRDALVRSETCGKILWTTGMLMSKYESHWLQPQIRSLQHVAGGRDRGCKTGGVFNGLSTAFAWKLTELSSGFVSQLKNYNTNTEGGHIHVPHKDAELLIITKHIFYYYTTATRTNHERGHFFGCIHSVSWSCEAMQASWRAPSHLLTTKLVHLQHEMLTVSMLEP